MSTPPIEVLRAAREWAAEHRHQIPDDRLIELAFAAGLSAGVAAGRKQALDVLRADLEIVLKQQVQHIHQRPGVWDSDNPPELAGTRCVECAARQRLAARLAEGGEPNAG